MTTIDLLGTAAGILTSFSFVPQVVRVLKTRSTKDISLFYFLILLIGISLWIVYGFLIQASPVIVFNIISFIFAATIVVCKLIYK